MPPEHEAPVRAFYDHEEDEPRSTRRRRAVADWGVSEDVFDRMPGPRFSRRGEAPPRRRESARGDDPRVEHGEEGRAARGDDARGGHAEDARFDRAAARSDDARGSRGADARLDRGVSRAEDAPGVRGTDARGSRGADVREPRGVDAPERRAEGVRDESRRRRNVDVWVDEDAQARPVIRAEEDEAPQERVADDWFAEPKPVSRTIVIEREPAAGEDLEPLPQPAARATSPDGRRTIVIGGHPDRLPVPRARTPRTAVSRIGPKPDRIVAYAVALGFLLILIAILSSH
jgi:hypothetical protein